MNSILKLGVMGAAALSFAACTTTGEVERNAAYGAAGGAAVGAGVGAVSGDVKVGEGAAVGAAVGAVAGAVYGAKKDQRRNGGTTERPILDKSQEFYDTNTGRYYYYERGTSRTFYANGEYRSG